MSNLISKNGFDLATDVSGRICGFVVPKNIMGIDPATHAALVLGLGGLAAEGAIDQSTMMEWSKLVDSKRHTIFPIGRRVWCMFYGESPPE